MEKKLTGWDDGKFLGGHSEEDDELFLRIEKLRFEVEDKLKGKSLILVDKEEAKKVEEKKSDLISCVDSVEKSSSTIEKKGKILKINTNKCRGELKLIKMIIKKRNWKEVFDLNADVFWSGLNMPYEDFSYALKTRVNRIPGMTELAHKRTTGFFLNKFQEYFPENFTFYPKTFMLPENLSRIKQFQKDNKCLMIAKPTNGSQGDGIYLLNSPNDLDSLMRALQYNDNKYIVQQYVDKPLIVDGKKFDLRLYVLISSLNPLVAWINEEGLARFCTEDYQKPSQENLLNTFMHMTNYSLNKNSKNYIYTDECEEINNGSKRTLTSFWKSIALAGIDKNKIMNNIEDLIRMFLTSMYPFMSYNQNIFFGSKKNEARCFQVIGFDILLDTDLKPWLLEINANPSLCIDHDPGFVKLIDISPVDFFVKERVVEHAMEIVTKKIEKQIEIGRDNYFKTYKLIVDGDLPEMQEMDVFSKILEIFGKLSGYKFKGTITSTKFSKLSNLKEMTNGGTVVRHDYDILFKNISKNYGMDFYDFIKAMEILAKKLYPVEDEDLGINLESLTKIVDNILSQI